MTQKEIAAGTIHKVPTDFGKALTSEPNALAAWKILQRSRVMNGYVGLNPLRNR